MAELGATADASTPYLRDLNASAGQLERFLNDLGPFADASKENVRTLAKTADTARPAIESAKPTVAELTKTTEKAPELANNLEIVLQRPRRPQPRGREGQALAGRPGLHRLRGVPVQYVFDQMMAINIFDENGYILKVNLSASECSEYQNADSIKRKEKESPGFISRCLAGLGPNQPGVTTADPTDTGVEDPGAPSRRRPRRRRRASPRRTEDKEQEQERARPARPQEGAREAAQGRRRREHADRAVAAERAACRTSRCRTSRRSRTSRTARAGSPRPVGRSQGPPRLPAEPMRGRAASSVFANPVLVGAVTVLVIIVAVFLSYNANNGLPFVPTTTLKVRFANGREPGQGQRDPLRRLPHRRRRGHEAGQALRRPRSAPSSSSSSTRRSARSPRTRAGASARARRSASSTSS